MRLAHFVRTAITCGLLAILPAFTAAQAPAWGNYNGNAQHNGISTTALQTMNVIKWSTPVDLNPQYTGGGALLIHYGSPLATAGNTIVVPVKTGASGGFQVEGRKGFDGTLLWTQTTDYLLPPHNWVPSYSPAIANNGRLYYPGEGGTIFSRNNLDAAGNQGPARLAFYGIDNYNANQSGARNNVFINTPITPDTNGTLYYGVQVTNTVTLGNQTLNAGGYIVRTDSSGNSSFVTVATAANDAAMNKVQHNSALAVSNDGQTVYAAVSTANGTNTGVGYLLALNSNSLAQTGRVRLKDVNTTANDARITDQSSASPMIGPDGDVYFGVLENTSQFRSRGWMLHFSADLATTKIASRFGWDNTASIVDSSLVPSYSGSSPYLIMSKYNNYAGTGGDGKNRLGIFDPFVSEPDEIYGTQVAKLVISVLGPTPDDDFPNVPGAVREWCINSAAVDPATKSILVNSEDGHSYRWDLTTNTLVQTLELAPPTGEAYTPTIIGPDGTGYAINNARLFALAAVGVPEPSTIALISLAALGGAGYFWRHRRFRLGADA